MEKITKKQAEDAVAAYLTAKREKQEIDARIKEAEDLVSCYCSDHINDFTDDRLALGNAIIAIRAGVAKPVKAGNSLSKADRKRVWSGRSV